jgi:hypothetical protein
MTIESTPPQILGESEAANGQDQFIDPDQQLLPHQTEIEAAIARMLEASPEGRKVHLRQVLWESLGVERMPSEDFGIFLSTFYSIPGVKKIEGKSGFVWLEGTTKPSKKPEKKVRTEMRKERPVGPLTSEEVVVVGSFEELLKGWRKDARNLPNGKGPKNRRRVHFKRIISIDQNDVDYLSDIE